MPSPDADEDRRAYEAYWLDRAHQARLRAAKLTGKERIALLERATVSERLARAGFKPEPPAPR